MGLEKLAGALEKLAGFRPLNLRFLLEPPAGVPRSRDGPQSLAGCALRGCGMRARNLRQPTCQVDWEGPTWLSAAVRVLPWSLDALDVRASSAAVQTGWVPPGTREMIRGDVTAGDSVDQIT